MHFVTMTEPGLAVFNFARHSLCLIHWSVHLSKTFRLASFSRYLRILIPSFERSC